MTTALILTGFFCLQVAFSNGDNVKSDDLQEFQQLFQQKRLHQLSAIKQLLNMSPEKQEKLLNAMLDKMTSVLEESKSNLIATQIELVEGLPDSAQERTYLALVLENTCLACDILLRFPNFMMKKLHQDRPLKLLYEWGMFFVKETVSFVMDDATKRLFYLAGQELQMNPDTQDKDYINPYKKVKSEPKKIMFADEPSNSSQQPRPKKAKKIKRGPRLTKSEL